MKHNYEDRSRLFLTRRTPVIMRLDGKAFHTFTRGFDRPFDVKLMFAMSATAKALCEALQGAQMAYTQSDEISILITDFKKLTTDAPFDYNIQKLASIGASMCTAKFLLEMQHTCSEKLGTKVPLFDCRVFNIPKEEVCNYFIWRQKDWARNSISMLTRSYYSHNEMHGKSVTDMHEMLHAKDANWANLDSRIKNGTFTGKGTGWTNRSAPIFTEPLVRTQLDDLLMPEEE